MTLFKILGNELSYEDRLQLDGAFAVNHINYGQSLIFNGNDSKNILINSCGDSLLSKDNIEKIKENKGSFDGTKVEIDEDNRLSLWENYWAEYINAFDKLVGVLPRSVATIYVGRQAIEIGFKYLLLKKTKRINKTHDLEKLSSLMFNEYEIKDSYMDNIVTFCKKYSKYIEGGNVEYFKYPEYKDTYFAGNCQDIKWISYNFALIILKLIHFADLDVNF